METTIKLSILIQDDLRYYDEANFGYAQKILSQASSRSVKKDAIKMLFRNSPEKMAKALDLI